MFGIKEKRIKELEAQVLSQEASNFCLGVDLDNLREQQKNWMIFGYSDNAEELSDYRNNWDKMCEEFIEPHKEEMKLLKKLNKSLTKDSLNLKVKCKKLALENKVLKKK